MRLFSRMVCARLAVEAAAAGLGMRTAGAAVACEADGEGGRGFGAASVGKRAAGKIFGGFGGFDGIVLLLCQELFAPDWLSKPLLPIWGCVPPGLPWIVKRMARAGVASALPGSTSARRGKFLVGLAGWVALGCYYFRSCLRPSYMGFRHIL